VAIPTPEPGLTVSYAYVWDREAQWGQEEGRKDRPCVMALAVERQADGEMLLMVLPMFHRPAADPAAAAEIPTAVKKHLGLDGERSWVIVSEGDQFVWLGYDLRKVRGTDRFDYGFLPPRFFNAILVTFQAWRQKHKVKVVTR
jgi:hypothetical protein